MRSSEFGTATSLLLASRDALVLVGVEPLEAEHQLDDLVRQVGPRPELLEHLEVRLAVQIGRRQDGVVASPSNSTSR